MKKGKMQKKATGPSKKSLPAGPINQHKRMAMGEKIEGGKGKK